MIVTLLLINHQKGTELCFWPVAGKSLTGFRLQSNPIQIGFLLNLIQVFGYYGPVRLLRSGSVARRGLTRYHHDTELHLNLLLDPTGATRSPPPDEPNQALIEFYWFDLLLQQRPLASRRHQSLCHKTTFCWWFQFLQQKSDSFNIFNLDG